MDDQRPRRATVAQVGQAQPCPPALHFLAMSLKNIQEEEQDLKLRLLRMQQLRIDLEQTIADVDRHREELVRIKQEVDELSRALAQRKDQK